MFHEVSEDELAQYRSVKAPSSLPADYSTVRFGGSFFLDQLLTGIEYDPILNDNKS